MGRFLYRPVCETCDECRPLRVDVRRFRRSKSQRRAWAKNADVHVSITDAEYSDEKRALLERYLDARHEGPMTAEENSMREFMYDTPGHTVCMDYRIDGRLVGSGLVDLLPDVVSSIYFFFDPDESRRSLGTFSMLAEIELAARRQCRWFHPGFYIRECAAMSYKADYKPCQCLDKSGEWIDV